MAKINIKNYWHPTPKKWRKLGDAIFGLGTVITTVTALTASPWVSVVAAGVTWLGKTMTNFASDESVLINNN